MKRIITAILLGMLAVAATAQEKKQGKMRFSGYSGGMMVHSGYVWGHDLVFPMPGLTQTVTMNGAPIGIGGAMKIGFGEHLRVGGEGYVSTLNYDKYGSYSSTGWGGVLAECIWTSGRWSWFAGGTIGGGGVKNLTMLGEIPLDMKPEAGDISYRHYAFMAVAPYIGVEFALTHRIHLCAKIDWLVNTTNPQPDFASGPRIYLGFMFSHSR